MFCDVAERRPGCRLAVPEAEGSAHDARIPGIKVVRAYRVPRPITVHQNRARGRVSITAQLHCIENYFITKFSFDDRNKRTKLRSLLDRADSVFIDPDFPAI